MKERIFRECAVISTIDDQAGLRIKVRLDPEDTYLKEENIPWCYPLLPKHFHLNPKIGEMVLVITSKIETSNSHRWFIGPIVAQQYGLRNENYLTAQSLLEEGRVTQPKENPANNPENNGTCPDREDVAIQGRNNADLILKENEVRLRCGFKKHHYGDDLLFNKDGFAYIQMKHRHYMDNKKRSFWSTINVVADRINLLSHDSKTPFDLKNPTSLITDDELLKIMEKAHPLPYGDNLIDFLKQLIEVIKTHTHPMAMDPPSFTRPQDKVLNTNLDNMLSTSIRIN